MKTKYKKDIKTLRRSLLKKGSLWVKFNGRKYAAATKHLNGEVAIEYGTSNDGRIKITLINREG